MVETNIDIFPYNTFGISAISQRFAKFSTVSELAILVEQRKPGEELLILGGGSNLLFTANFNGLILKNELLGIEIVREDGNDVYVKSGAGENWHDFVLKMLDCNLGGLENLSLIPGNVGTSPMQNIGAYGCEIKDVFYELEAYHISSNEIHTFTNEQCEFGYRESVFKNKFKNKYVILNVTFKLNKVHQLNTNYGAIKFELEKMGVENPSIKDVSNAVIAIRESKLPNPKEIGNAGSFFKNPVVRLNTIQQLISKYPEMPMYQLQNEWVKVPAGWLIEQAGWKGKTFGNYGVHKLQALVLVNYGGASGKQIFDLSQQIIDDVKQKFGIELEREVNIIS